MATTSDNNPVKTIGIDLGDRKSALCVIDASGTISSRLELRTTQNRLRKYFENLEPVRVVVEASTHSTWVSELLQGFGHEIFVANPRKISLITKNISKSDRVDSEVLARLGRLDPQLLSPVVHRCRETRASLEFIRARKLLVETRTKLINHIRGAVKSFGARVPSCTSERFAKHAQLYVPEQLRSAVAPVLRTLDAVNAEVKQLDKEIETGLRSLLPEMKQLEQVDGVGALTAATFLLTLEDASRFRSSRSVGAYLGLVPRRKQSGERDPALRITKAGDGYLRRLLVNCAQYILGPFGKESDLRRWGLQLAERGGKRGKRRAAVGVARRLAILLHRLWRSGAAYVPVGYNQSVAF